MEIGFSFRHIRKGIFPIWNTIVVIKSILTKTELPVNFLSWFAECIHQHHYAPTSESLITDLGASDKTERAIEKCHAM